MSSYSCMCDSTPDTSFRQRQQLLLHVPNLDITALTLQYLQICKSPQLLFSFSRFGLIFDSGETSVPE